MRITRQFVRRGLVAALFVSAAMPALVAAQAVPDAKTLMDKHNAAMGSKAALDKHTSVHMTATMSIPAAGMEASMEMYRARPNKYLQKVTIGSMGEITQGYDGKVAWAVNPMSGPQLAEGEALESAKSQADFFANFQDPVNFTRAESVGLTDFEGRKCYEVKVSHGAREGSEYFDAETGLLAGFKGTNPTPQGNIESTTVFSDYTDFGGVKFPKRIEQRSQAANVTINFTAIEYDNVDMAMFDLPAAVKALVKP